MPTAHGARYVEQLCRHWAHKLEVEREPEGARIALPSGTILRFAASDASLDVAIEAAGAALLDEAKEVVRSHLDRFAFREAPLRFDWR